MSTQLRTDTVQPRTERPVPATRAGPPRVRDDIAPVRNLLASLARDLAPSIDRLAALSQTLVDDMSHLVASEHRPLLGALGLQSIWLRSIVDNMLSVEALQTNRFHLRREAVDLREVTADVLAIVEPVLRQRKQRLLLRINPATPAVRGDRRWIGQVFLNLLLNATKFAGADSPIWVALTPRAGAARVLVSDRGPGLSWDDDERLFHPFVHGSGLASEGPAGAGLGLSIAKTVVEALHGRLVAENRPGGGARFWFELPLADEHIRPVELPSYETEGAPAIPIRVQDSTTPIPCPGGWA